MLCVMPYFASTPKSPSRSPVTAGVAVRSRVAFEIAYGLISRFLAPDGTSSPTSVAISDDWKWPRSVIDGRNAREVRDLVLPAIDAAGVEPPQLRPPGLVAKRLERDRGFDRPAAVEPADREIPDRVPVHVHLAFVGHLRVDPAADGVQLEHDGVAPVVEAVEPEREAVVLHDAGVVAPHLVDDHPIGVALPAARGHVDVARGRTESRLRSSPIAGAPSCGSFWMKSDIDGRLA